MGDDSPLSADEVLDIVDERDRVMGQAPRSEAYAARLRHRCVFVLVRNEAGRIFVHRRTVRKLVFPSRYDMFVGGVVGAGESYDAAALREAQEELGVSGLPAPVPLFKFLYETPEHNWWSFVYETRCTQSVAPPAEEVAWHAFLTEEDLEQRLAEWAWVPDGLAAYRRLRAFPSETAPVEEELPRALSGIETGEPEMARSAEQELEVRDAPHEAFRHVAEVLVQTFGGPVEQVSGTELAVTTGAGLRSWGERVSCTVEPTGGGARIVVSSTSRVSTTLFDWGKNADNVAQVVGALRHLLNPVG